MRFAAIVLLSLIPGLLFADENLALKVARIPLNQNEPAVVSPYFFVLDESNVFSGLQQSLSKLLNPLLPASFLLAFQAGGTEFHSE